MERDVFGTAQRSLSPGIGPCLQSVSLSMGGVLLVGYFSEHVWGGGVLRFYWDLTVSETSWFVISAAPGLCIIIQKKCFIMSCAVTTKDHFH